MDEKAARPHTSHDVRTVRAALERLEARWERQQRSAPLVSSSQLRLLYALESAAGSNLRELCVALDSAAPALSRLCARLEAMGLIKRASSARSRREIELYLTGRATAYLRELRKEREQFLATVLDAMPDGERAALVKGMDGLRRALDPPRPGYTGNPVIRSA
ncbi:MarR family transcriptional regulator [Streptomyces sp. SID1328]|uniref:MarR family winged helix-turn-helix transcriptional regulator n=1 Tax=Streptomyces sp. SID1328 TaxID=2690250 RepID=UPI00136EF32F|nr:MarR family transcriptional regulator [Streptomyces sp. SID1328]MYV40815.1 MarR family transcriptional regulator [Streptomyces sp. SID1328]